MADLEFSFCPYCGQRFPSADWPRICPDGHASFRNPAPVAAVVVPVDDGLLVVRRTDAKYRGQLAIPGGYVNYGEAWQAAARRELLEETGLDVDIALLRLHDVISTSRGHMVNIYAIAPPMTADELARHPFVPNAETSERLVIREPQPLAFPQDTEVVRRWLETK